MKNPAKPLEADIPLRTFSDFSRAIPKRWKGAPLYIVNSIGKYERAVQLLLVTDAVGRKGIVIGQNYATRSEASV